MTALALMNPQEPDLKALSVPELREELNRCLGFTAIGLMRAARILQELEGRGEDPGAIHNHIRNQLRRIASGQLLPEVLIRFAGKPSLLSKVARLPVPDQQKIVSGAEGVPVVEFTPTGETAHTLQDPSALEPIQIQQVFAGDHIRSIPEQRNWLLARRAKTQASRPERIEEDGIKLSIDRERGGATHRGEFIPLHVLVAAVKALRK